VSAVVVGVASVVGVEDALVAHGEGAGEEQGDGGEAGESAPAACDVGGGGVFDRGEAAFGAGAAPVGVSPGGVGVGVFLGGLALTLGGTVIEVWVQQRGGCSGGSRISGRSWGRLIVVGRSGQRILPVVAGQATRW
jgi:hypothetical protein